MASKAPRRAEPVAYCAATPDSCHGPAEVVTQTRYSSRRAACRDRLVALNFGDAQVKRRTTWIKRRWRSSWHLISATRRLSAQRMPVKLRWRRPEHLISATSRLSRQTMGVKRGLRRSGHWDTRQPGAGNRSRFRARSLAEEKKMTTPSSTTPISWPRCPQKERFPLITGFITPASDLPPPHGLDASITLDVTDPTENNERIRVVETDTPWDLTVKWCICGPYTDIMCGCWCVQVFIDDIDGVGETSGLLGSYRLDVKKGGVVVPPTPPGNDDTSKRCYKHKFPFPAYSVSPGVYNLVVIITLATDDCDDNPTTLADDVLGYAVIPVLVFYDENAPFCPDPSPPPTAPPARN